MTVKNAIISICLLPVLALSQETIWEKTNSPLEHVILTMITSSDNYVLAGNIPEGTHLSTDYGETWVQVSPGVARSYTRNSMGQLFWVGDGSVWISEDSGFNWSRASVLGSTQVGCNHNDVLFAFGDSTMYRSGDNGQSWEDIGNGFPQVVQMWSIAFGADSTTIFTTPWGVGIYRSIDNGDTWHAASQNIQPSDRDIRDLAVTSDGHVFAASYSTANGVYRSTDNGDSWELILVKPHAKALVVSSKDEIVVSTNLGLYLSKDRGETWTPWNEGLPAGYDQRGDILVFTIDSNDNIYAGMSSGDVYRRLSTPTSVQQSPSSRSPGFTLFQNYPNPFNPSTAIQFEIPYSSDVRLEIFNILGEKVITLVDRKLKSGQHSFAWDGKSANGMPVPTGEYFYRLQAGDFSGVKKLLYIQ